MNGGAQSVTMTHYLVIDSCLSYKHIKSGKLNLQVNPMKSKLAQSQDVLKNKNDTNSKQ
jgi:hypothetical protein